MPIFRGTNNIKKIFRGNNEIVKVFRGTNLIFTSGLPQYEELADIIVTSNTTQIDFDNLNITKDDELRLVYTLSANTTTSFYGLFPNNNTTTSNYYIQQLFGSGSSIGAVRANENLLILRSGGTGRKTSGFADIKISNNDRFVAQSQHINLIGSNSSSMENINHNVVGTFSISTITKLSFISTQTNAIGVGSRLQLYKVNTGVA